MEFDKEYIMCSAIWYDDGIKRTHRPKCITTGYVICGFRHHDCFATLANTLGHGNYDKSKMIQGFITSHNRFLGRESSRDVAIESIHKQIQENKEKIFGELGQDSLSGPEVNLSKAVSVVEDSKYDNGKLFVDVRILKEDLPLDLLQPALRTMGTVDDNVVQKDVKITAVDLVPKDKLKDD